MEDELLRLRPWLPSDAGAVARAGRDPDVRRFRTSPPRIAEEVNAWLSDVAPGRLRGERIDLAVIDAKSETVLGAVTLWSIDLERRSARISYWVAAEARRRG